MKLITMNDLQNKSLVEMLKEMDLVKTNIHSDNNGNVLAVELKYAPKNSQKIARSY